MVANSFQCSLHVYQESILKLKCDNFAYHGASGAFCVNRFTIEYFAGTYRSLEIVMCTQCVGLASVIRCAFEFATCITATVLWI